MNTFPTLVAATCLLFLCACSSPPRETCATVTKDIRSVEQSLASVREEAGQVEIAIQPEGRPEVMAEYDACLSGATNWDQKLICIHRLVPMERELQVRMARKLLGEVGDPNTTDSLIYEAWKAEIIPRLQAHRLILHKVESGLLSSSATLLRKRAKFLVAGSCSGSQI